MATFQARKDGETGRPIAWQARVRIQSHPQHVETFPRKADAENWATELERGIRLGVCPVCEAAKPKPHAYTFSEMVQDYLGSARFRDLKPRSQEQAAEGLRYLLADPRWGDVLASALSVAMANSYREARLRDFQSRGRHGGSRINRLLTYANIAIRHAVDSGKLALNPIAGFRRAKENPHRDRVLTPVEYEALKSRLPVHLHALYELSYRLPFRLRELLTLRWPQVDFEKGCIRLEAAQTKVSAARTLPFLYPHLVPLLAGLPSRFRGGLVFCRSDGRPLPNFRRDWVKALAESGVTGFTWHGLRHCAITQLLTSGVDPVLVQHMAGHRTPLMQSKYTHVQAHQILKAAERYALTV